MRAGDSNTCRSFTDGIINSYGRCKNPSTVHADGPPSLPGKDKSLSPLPSPWDQAVAGRTKDLCPTRLCVPLEGGKDPLAGRGLEHLTNGQEDIRTHHQNGSKESYGRCTNPSTVHSHGPPSLFPGTRLFLFVTAVAGRTTTCPLPLFFLFHLFYNHIQLSWKGT